MPFPSWGVWIWLSIIVAQSFSGSQGSEFNDNDDHTIDERTAFHSRIMCSLHREVALRKQCTDQGPSFNIFGYWQPTLTALESASHSMNAVSNVEEAHRAIKSCFSLVQTGRLDALHCSATGLSLLVFAGSGAAHFSYSEQDNASAGGNVCALSLSAAMAVERLYSGSMACLQVAWMLAECAAQQTKTREMVKWRAVDAVGAAHKALVACSREQGACDMVGMTQAAAEVIEFVLGAGHDIALMLGIDDSETAQDEDALEWNMPETPNDVLERGFGPSPLVVHVHGQVPLCPVWGNASQAFALQERLPQGEIVTDVTIAAGKVSGYEDVWGAGSERDEVYEATSIIEARSDNGQTSQNSDEMDRVGISEGGSVSAECSVPSTSTLSPVSTPYSNASAMCAHNTIVTYFDTRALPDVQGDESNASDGNLALRRFLQNSMRVLVVELSFGGLSNRRLALECAVVAARLLRRKLVISHHFDEPLPESFGPCLRCVRPLDQYYDMRALTAWVPTLSFDQLMEMLERSPPPRVRAACRGRRCLSPLPDWLVDAQRRTPGFYRLQSAARARDLEAMSAHEFVQRLGKASEHVLWIDSGFRLLDTGTRAIMDANEHSKARHTQCVQCTKLCHSPEHNAHVAAAGWCDHVCALSCNTNCSVQCKVDVNLLVNGSRLPSVAVPHTFAAMLPHLRHSAKLEAAASVVAQTLGGGDGTYMCAHWRTGDWSYPMTADMLVDSVLGVLDIVNVSQSSDHNISGLFLATDAKHEQRQEIYSRLPVLTPCAGEDATSERCRDMLREMRHDDWMQDEWDSVEGALLEQLVCARARVFVGTRGSTFSEVIIQERIRRGWRVDSNFLVH